MQRAPKKVHRSPGREIRLLAGGAHEAARNAHFPPHSHSHWELVYYRSGTIECVMAGKGYPTTPGLVWLTPPGVTHAERALTSYSNFFIALENVSADRWPSFLHDDADRSISRACQQIVIECNRKGKDRDRMMALMAEQLTYLLNRVASQNILPRPVQIVLKAEQFIEEKCKHPLSINQVADAVFVSPSSLRGHFQMVRQTSPRAYLQKARLARAMAFLRTSNLKLEAIAEVCGYDSASHLSRYVKKATGKAPGKLRAQ